MTKRTTATGAGPLTWPSPRSKRRSAAQPSSGSLLPSLALVLAATACVGAGGGGDDDALGPDARQTTDASGGDGAPADDARMADAGLAPFHCHPLDLTPAQTCAIAMTSQVGACSIDPTTGVPSQTGWLEVGRPDGSSGYLCAQSWSAAGGYYISTDRRDLVAAASACCGGPAAPTLSWPAADPYFGVPHGPTHIKPQELVSGNVGPMLHNPFAVVVSSAASAATFLDARATWSSWDGDGRPHPGPDGTGPYYFPPFPLINYVLQPTVNGDPIVVIGPEPSLDPGYTKPIGHPALGDCGGAPLAYMGGEVHNTVLTDHSGRFGSDPSITPASLDNAATLLNCYGISITSVEFTPPGQ